MKIGKVKLPDFLIVGAAKSGTTSLYNYLIQHPKIFFPEIKEPQYWAMLNDNAVYKGFDTMPLTIKTLKEYEDLYSSNKHLLSGDASPSSLYRSENVVSKLKKVYGKKYKNLKIVIILRNPIDRAWSQYWHFKKYRNENLSVDKAFSKEVIEDRLNNGWNYFYDYIGFGMYFRQVNDFLTSFENVKIYLFEDLKENSDIVVDDLVDFLGLAKGDIDTGIKYNLSGAPNKSFYGILWQRVYSNFPFRKWISRVLPKSWKVSFNNYIGRRALEKQPITSTMYNHLLKIYSDDILKLEKLIDRDLSNWLREK